MIWDPNRLTGDVRLGIAGEAQRGFSNDVALGVEAVAAECGWSHRRVDGAADEEACQTVLAIGDVSLFPDLVHRPKTARRVLWHGEVLPRPTPESGMRLHSLLPTGRLLDVAARVLPSLADARSFVRWREQAAIVREPLANLDRLKRASGSFDRIVIDAYDRARGAREAGLAVDVVPYGYHASFAGALSTGGERPIDALLVGHLVGRHGRRQRHTKMLERDLARRSVVFEHLPAGTYGPARTAVLRRASIVVDVHRIPGNFPGFRFIVAVAAGAALVSEPLEDPRPLVPGVHYLESPAALMPEAISELLSNEARRRSLVEAAQELLTNDLDMHHVLPRVLGADAAEG